jgi:hypothetical protein
MLHYRAEYGIKAGRAGRESKKKGITGTPFTSATHSVRSIKLEVHFQRKYSFLSPPVQGDSINQMSRVTGFLSWMRVLFFT